MFQCNNECYRKGNAFGQLCGPFPAVSLKGPVFSILSCFSKEGRTEAGRNQPWYWIRKRCVVSLVVYGSVSSLHTQYKHWISGHQVKNSSILVPLSIHPLMNHENAIKQILYQSFYSHIIINDCMLIKFYVRTWRTKSWHFAWMSLDHILAYLAMLIEK